MLSSISADSLFVNAYQQQQALESLSNNALNAGMDLYGNEDYEAAARAFQRAIDLAPQSDYAADACNYLSMSHLKLGEEDKAIEAYVRWIQLNPDDAAPHVKLGKLYFDQERYTEAEGEFSEAVRIDPTNAENAYSLGQAYLFLERFTDAEAQFRKVQQLQPKDPAGYYGLGLAASKEGRYERAIKLFDQAIALDHDFYDAYAEKGYVYADMGNMDAANKLFELLEKEDEDLADTLSRYIYKVDPPKIAFASALTSTFSYNKSRMTQVSDLDSYLENANASASFTMVFQFDKQMDRLSIEDRFNWMISRTLADGSGTAYNFGLTPPDTEVSITSFPDYVYYDEDALTATVHFTIDQNDSADGTMDPSHIEFKFMGEDEWGLSMDKDADQFTGFSGVF
ncbi:MAG: tetratricopeptide repeat protein [Deltaproteobacteria bacterium]|nr:tetratricopeptide repeat protein [Deltaproteobacteria bacterium]